MISPWVRRALQPTLVSFGLDQFTSGRTEAVEEAEAIQSFARPGFGRQVRRR